MPQPEPVNRRAAIRFPATLLGSLQPVAPKGAPSWVGQIRDISAGGISLLVGNSFEAGTLLAVEPHRPPDGAPTFLLVRVVRAARQTAGSWLIGGKLVRELCESEVAAMR
jgi:hypothetical protein